MGPGYEARAHTSTLPWVLLLQHLGFFLEFTSSTSVTRPAPKPRSGVRAGESRPWSAPITFGSDVRWTLAWIRVVVFLIQFFLC